MPHTTRKWKMETMTGDGRLYVSDQTNEIIAQIWYSDLEQAIKKATE